MTRGRGPTLHRAGAFKITLSPTSGSCPHCGVAYPRGRYNQLNPANKTRDHILPKARGGTDVLFPHPGLGAARNIRDACQQCNVQRGNCGHCIAAMACVADVAKARKTRFNVVYKAWKFHIWNGVSSIERPAPVNLASPASTIGRRKMSLPTVNELQDVDPKGKDLVGFKVILLNGPPGSGKDTGGAAITKHIRGGIVAKFARRLKESVHADYGLAALPHDHFEAVKDTPHPAFFGKTPREAYIFKSEHMVKPNLGTSFYGQVFLRDLYAAKKAGVLFAAVTDSGFSQEAWSVIPAVGINNVHLIRVHADGRGKTFAGDSRTYIQLNGVKTTDIHNDGSDSAAFCAEIVQVARAWLGAAGTAL